MQCLLESFASIYPGDLENAVVRSPIEGIALAIAGRPTVKSLSVLGARQPGSLTQPMKSAAPKNEFR
jgi:hypothetical protein